jgi:hypothetical protein
MAAASASAEKQGHARCRARARIPPAQGGATTHVGGQAAVQAGQGGQEARLKGVGSGGPSSMTSTLT